MISIRELSKQYFVKNKPIDALKNINLEVNKGEVFGIIGQSGAGKSTLIRCINMLEKPSHGHVIIDDQDLTLMSKANLRKARHHIGMIFQQFNLLSRRNVYENISFPLELEGMSPKEIRNKVTPLLELTGLTKQYNQFPSQLSGGQKQRVAIARALAASPKILLCDEATSALDPKTTQSILELLRDINQELGITILLITHEMEVIKTICDKVAILSEGEIIEQGPALELFTHPKTDIAQDFVKAASRMDLPPALKEIIKPRMDPNDSTLLRVSYHGDSASQPVIGYLMQKYHVTLSILQANIEIIQHQTVGTMIVEITGDDTNITKSIEFLERNDLKVEKLGYVDRNF